MSCELQSQVDLANATIASLTATNNSLQVTYEAELDDDIKVIIFKGAGRAFSAGADLSGVGYVYGMKDPKPGERKKQKVPQRIKLDFDRNLFFDFHRKLLLCTKITIAHGGQKHHSYFFRVHSPKRIVTYFSKACPVIGTNNTPVI